MATEGIRNAYETGKGSITVRGRAYIEGIDAGTSEAGTSQGATLPPVPFTKVCSHCNQQAVLLCSPSIVAFYPQLMPPERQHVEHNNKSKALSALSPRSPMASQNPCISLDTLCTPQARGSCSMPLNPLPVARAWQGPAKPAASGRARQGRGPHGHLSSSQSCPTRPTRPTSWRASRTWSRTRS